ncbi:MAG: diaminopimelate decarboxylase [Candidatus Yanofskybacteria bacterium RIFCSPLOWO2_02_FULL_47_9b]|uniref:Diaminopimelate decarboxylase n=1 Tax=Candidatus Yanofskybacteria bacterium RIFCSPLOWO2_02_FULL_47_9b TaxID=1802708 RepID=A0A1F8HCW7_9BACT|nr:MAG: diaminopimelate decarboxylase [Candidatus Yanofskybacteria bacterium RIFCSPLOWO2_02_FULL_47_9b]
MKKFPLSKKETLGLIKKYPTPFHLYDEKAIRTNAQRFQKAFAWAPGFRNYFAVKACPNPVILKILAAEGMGVDCSSFTELVLIDKLGFMGEDIMFSSNDTAYSEFTEAKRLNSIINLDDTTQLAILEKTVGLPELLCFRYNPGSLREHKGNIIIGNPEEAKFGMTKMQLFDAYRTAKEKGVKRFGLHAMIVSNELISDALAETANMLFTLAGEISKEVGISFEFINLGGGIGIPYRPEQKAVGLEELSAKIEKLYREKITTQGLGKIKIYMECGRMITGPYGYLVSTIINTKDIYRKYIGIDASMANLMRPGMYGAYHHINILGKESSPQDLEYDVVGSLCENNDKFAINRKLPRVEIGDIAIIYDTGAHGYSMGFNYNGKLRSSELLLKTDDSVEQIRRAETLEDYFATVKNFLVP